MAHRTSETLSLTLQGIMIASEGVSGFLREVSRKKAGVNLKVMTCILPRYLKFSLER